MGAPGAAGAAGTSGTPGAAGAQGPSGVLSVVSVPSASGTWAASGTANAFFGGFATVTLTGNQRVTGVVSAVAGTAALGLTATCSFALCHRPSGSTAAPTRFDQGRFIYLSDVGRAFTGSETVILPAGTWDIGLCGYVLEPNQVNGTSVGWVMVTN